MKRLNTWMRKNRISQSELARRLDVTQPTVWAWCHGQKWPTMGNLIELSKETGLTVDALLDRRRAA